MTQAALASATVSLVSSLALAATLAAAEPRAGLSISPLALSCQGCHQPLVDSPEMPALGRMRASAIADRLRAERDHPDPASIMSRLVARLTDREIDDLSAELGEVSSATKPAAP